MAILKNIPMLKKIIDFGKALIVVLILSAVVGLVLAFPVMGLWNFVFGALYPINVFQAWAFNMLVSMLLGQRSASRQVQQPQ